MNWLCRIAVVCACGWAAWWSGRMAWADWLAPSGGTDGLVRAVRLEPRDARLVSIKAVLESENEPAAPTAEQELLHASQLNPYDSGVLMALGLRAELRGSQAAAERWLVAAAAVDHQFKPAWALANFYLRTGQTAKMWPYVERCFKLDPLGFDPGPVFDLCWNATSDENRILALIPKKRPRLIEYAGYLIRTGRMDAALHLWPAALAVADVSAPGDVAALLPFSAALLKEERVDEAVNVWNDLVGRSFVQSGRLAPQAGVSIADPLFSHVDSGGVFAWRTSGAVPGMFARDLAPSLQLEMDGNQPETLTLLRVLSPVLPARTYRLAWNTDASHLSSPKDAAFSYVISARAGAVLTRCSLLAGPSACSFSTGPDVHTLRIELVYGRAPGTVRSKGSLRLTKTALELAG